MQNFTPVSALLGGALIGLSALLLFRCNGRIAGISSIMSGLFTSHGNQRHWRISFLIGLLAGTGLWSLLTSTPPVMPSFHSPILIGFGGFLVGFGTRLGSGCTSGHGICGMALLSRRSIVATLTFMATGLLTVYFLRHVLGVGS